MKTNRKILLVAVLAIAAVSGTIAYQRLASASAIQPQADTAVAKISDLSETVSASGHVKATSDVSLSFERSGKIAGVAAQVGQTVSRGQVLASLDTTDLKIQLDLAQNALDSANLKLDQLKNAAASGGSGATQIQTAINNSRENQINKIKEAYIAADGILGSSIDQFFDEPKSNKPLFGMTVTQGVSTYLVSAPYETSVRLNKERYDITASIVKWSSDLVGLNEANIDSAQSDAENSLGQLQTLLTDLAAFMNSYKSDNGSDNLFYNSYKLTVQNARTAIDSTLAGILSAKQAYNSSRASVNPDEIKAQEIAVSNSQIQIKSIQNQIAKSSIVSPISGVIGTQNAKIGETAAVGVPLINVFSDSRLQIDIFLPESDIAKIKVGQVASVMLDAFDGKTFSAHVIGVDPEAQKTAGAQSYKVTLQFDQADSNIKPGMTANANIETNHKSGVIAIPATAIVKKDGKNFVIVKTDRQGNEEREITTGITDQNGTVEVTGGLKGGETIINY